VRSAPAGRSSCRKTQTDLEADRQVANTLATLIIGGALASIEITDEADDGAADDADGDEGTAA